MDSVEMSSNRECTEVSTAEVLASEPEHSNRYNVFGEPEVLPRVGAEYQAIIPDLISGQDFMCLKLDPFDNLKPITECGPHKFHFGLHIPVMWVSQATDNGKLDSKVKIEGSGNSVSKEEVETQNSKRCNHESCLPVPGSQCNLWNQSEEANFLAGLYIFGKNLIQVKKFMDNKSMGAIMSFYYGKFYGTPKYRRWSMCRKMKSKRCIYGQKIFTGSRQQELLSRLLSQVTEESKSKLIEVSRAFGEGKTSLEEYVFTLKAIVGLRTLVEAIGIGKGKQDLTGMGNEHSKPTNPTAPLCPEVPIGKACSSLTTSEIVTFLTGNFRLSKARSNDLFWEAVWPRLLARGWHSEQPENGFLGSRHNSLVFLVPGVKRFSKRKLVKGEHYFDSVSDVLNRVASEPALLDLDAQGGGEAQWANEVRSDNEESSDEERHCYLKPRSSDQSRDGLMFTVVDTSMAVNGRASKIRELRSLPSDISFTSHFEEDNGDAGSSLGDDSSNLSIEEADTSNPVKNLYQQKDAQSNDLFLRNHKKTVSEVQPRQQRVKPKTKKRQKLEVSDCALRSCTINEASHSTRIDQEVVNCCPADRPIIQAGPSPETLSSTNSPSRDITVNSCHGPESLSGPCSTIDLNLPVYPDGRVTDHDNLTKQSPPHDSKHPDNAEDQANNGRRQSRRNRPLTTKALEALAFGLLDTKKKRRNRDEFPHEVAPRPSRRKPSGACSTEGESYSSGFMELSMEDKGSDDRGSESAFGEKHSGFSL